MTPGEVATLLSMVSALGTGQDLPEDALKAWTLLLSDVRALDAYEAVRRIATRERFVDVAKIRAEVRVIRGERLAACPVPLPNVDPDDVAAYRAEAKALLQAIGDGAMDRAAVQAYQAGGQTLTGAQAREALNAAQVTKDVLALTAGTFRGPVTG